MCFSAEASFAGSVIISAIGIATVTRVHKPSQLVFACIPLFFGMQQLAEGILWLTLPHPEHLALQKIDTYIFLIMAQVVWPTMIPLSVLLMEKLKKRRRFIVILLAMGLSVSLYYAYCLIFMNVNPQITGYHIQYRNDFPQGMANWVFAVYLIASITPLFVSSIKRTHLLGVLMFLSCLVTAIFFRQYLTSVWCFFAAFISGVIYWILSDSKKQSISDKLAFTKILATQP